MYTIVMNKDKSLQATKTTTIYQRENLVDKIQFLFPQQYDEFDFTTCTATLKYVDQANIPHAEILQQDKELYKDRVRFLLPINTDLTKYSGDVTIRITCSKIDMENQKQYVLHTGEIVISVSPLKDYYSFVPDESLEFVDQLVGNLEAKIEATEKIAEIYDNEKADNLSYVDSKLQLTANGKKIGDAITIVGGDNPGGGDSEFEVVEF